jgi:hypothetical protein
MSVLNLSDIFELLHGHLCDKAQPRGITGAFAVCDLQTREIRFAFVGPNIYPLRVGVPGKSNLNYLGIALTKLAVCATYGRDSGNAASDGVEVIGEPPWQGGVLGSTKGFAYAFSGAEQEVDRELMLSVRDYHEGLIKEAFSRFSAALQ